MRNRLSTTRHVVNRTIRQRCRAYATHQQQPSQPQRAAPRSSLISQKTAKEWKELSTPQKGNLGGWFDGTRFSYGLSLSVVAASKATVNVGVILAGVALTGGLLFLVGRELFGSDSTTAIFSDAVDRINAHPEVRASSHHHHDIHLYEPNIHILEIRSLNSWENLSKHMANQVESVIDVFSIKSLRMVKAIHICLCDSTLKDKTTEALLCW